MSALPASPAPAIPAEATTPAPAAPAAEAKRVRPPLNDEQRKQAAERARKRRAFEKLKGAKSEAKFKELAAEIAAEPAPERPQWPTAEEFQAAVKDLSPMLEAAQGFLAETPFELNEKKCQILALSLAPVVAQGKKNPGASALLSRIDPSWVAIAGLVAVFGPPLLTQARELVGTMTKEPTA